MRTYFLGVSYPFCLEIETDKATERKEKDVLVTDALGGNNEDIVLSVGENRHISRHHFETMGGLNCKSGLKIFSRGDQRWAKGVCVRDILWEGCEVHDIHRIHLFEHGCFLCTHHVYIGRGRGRLRSDDIGK